LLDPKHAEFNLSDGSGIDFAFSIKATKWFFVPKDSFNTEPLRIQILDQKHLLDCNVPFVPVEDARELNPTVINFTYPLAFRFTTKLPTKAKMEPVLIRLLYEGKSFSNTLFITVL
jgi:hypothetical protein